MKREAPVCRQGGLTLVPIPGFERLALALKDAIEALDPDKYKYTPVDIVMPGFSRYSNGETNFRCTNEHILEHDCFVIGGGPMTDDLLMKLVWTVGMLPGRHAGRISIVSPYFPHSRADKDEGDDILSMLPIILSTVDSAAGKSGLWRWICFDPHSDQITGKHRSGLVTPIYLTRKLLRFALERARQSQDGDRSIVLGFPDSSAERRYRPAMKTVMEELDEFLPRVVVNKERKGPSTEILTISGDTEAVPNARVLMFDDEIASGGTSIDMARAMKATFGAKSVWACATHPVLCAGAPARLLNQTSQLGGQWIDHLIFADTIPLEDRGDVQALIQAGRMSVYTALEDMAQIIYRVHWGRGVRGLR